MTAESVGRTMGPVSFSNVLAWSISSSSRFIDFRFVFLLAAVIMSIVLVLSQFTLKPELFSSFSKDPARSSDIVAKDEKLPNTKQSTFVECALPESSSENQEDRYRKTPNARENTRLLGK